MKTKSKIPWIKKQSATIVAVGDTGQEPSAIRSILEWLNYRVDILWIGSRAEFVAFLNGEINTSEYVILSIHGGKKGILMPNEKEITSKDISKSKLNGKTIISLGCNTATKEFADAFIKGAQSAVYIAPTDYIWGGVTPVFISCMFFEIQRGNNRKSIKESFNSAKKAIKEAKSFRLFT